MQARDLRLLQNKIQFVRFMMRFHGYQIPKAAYRRVAVTPPPPASRRPGGGGVTAYMPRKAACWQWSAEGRKEAGGRGEEERDEAEEKKVELAT